MSEEAADKRFLEVSFQYTINLAKIQEVIVQPGIDPNGRIVFVDRFILTLPSKEAQEVKGELGSHFTTAPFVADFESRAVDLNRISLIEWVGYPDSQSPQANVRFDDGSTEEFDVYQVLTLQQALKSKTRWWFVRFTA